MAIARWLVAWLLAGSQHSAVSEEEKASEDSCPGGTAPQHPAANRAVDLNRSGSTPHTPPKSLSRPAWTFDSLDGRAFHQTPVIDSELNVYMGSDAGYIFSLNRDGKLRWKAKLGTRHMQCPSLHRDRVYTASGDGFVFALNAATGQEIWRSRVAQGNPPDTYAVTATDEVVMAPAQNVMGIPFGAADVVALDPNNGTILWRYNLGVVHRALTVNFLPVVHKGSVLFSDSAGGVHHLRLRDGKGIWSRPGEDPSSFGLGGVGMGPNGVLYIGSSTPKSPLGKGLIRALDLNGKLLWERRVPLEIHAAPAVGQLRPGGPLALVIGTGTPAGDPPSFKEWALVKLRLAPAPYHEGIVYALDAATGDQLWTFRPEPWREKACAGSSKTMPCLPDLWSLPVIAPDGTTYINWSAGGMTYALKDANGNGVVEEKDPAEVQSYKAGSGATGPPVVAPGMMVTAACRFLYAFKD